MNILIPVLGFGKSGGQRVLSSLANEFIVNGHDVTFVVPESDPIPYYPTKARILKSKVTTKYGKICGFLINLFFLLKKSRSVKADIAIANYFFTAYIVLFLSFRIRKFYYIQAYEVNFGKKSYMKFLAFLTYLLPLNKIVNSDTLLPEFLNNHVGIVPAGLDLELYSTTNLPNLEKNINIGIIGRKESYKGTIESIKAISFVKNNNKNKINVNIAIHVPCDIDSYLFDFNYFEINNDVELSNFYKKADIVVAVGLIEDGAFHYPCAEAMASNCLTISNYSPLFNAESSLFIKTYSQQEIISKLEFALSMTRDEIKNEVTRNLSEMNSFAWESIGKRMLKLLAGH